MDVAQFTRRTASAIFGMKHISREEKEVNNTTFSLPFFISVFNLGPLIFF